MRDNAGGRWSGSDLWEAWYEDELNWQNLNLEILDEKEEAPNIESHKSDGEIIDQEWPLRDPHGFYYPLFGLGQNDSRIAIVATGPGHNIEDPWDMCREESGYREAYKGPLTNESIWFGSKQNDNRPEEHWYAANFAAQKDDWMRFRENEQTELVNNLEKIQASIPGADGSVFDTFYYTNFMKDGEYTRGSDDSIRDLEDIKKSFQDTDETPFIDFEDHSSPIIHSCEWPNYKNRTSKAEKVCELASRQFWLPVLGAELASVEPNVIVPMGKKATLAIFKLYGIDINWDTLYEVALDEYRGSERGPAVVPSYHWSGANRNISNNEENLYENLDAGMQDRNDELLESTDEKVTKDTYWRLLANQIARCI